jgi:hypothetical protein
MAEAKDEGREHPVEAESTPDVKQVPEVDVKVEPIGPKKPFSFTWPDGFKITETTRSKWRAKREEIKTEYLRRRAILIAKLKKVWDSWPVQKILGTDLTFIFIWLALYLFGFKWDWRLLLASIGLWFSVKEVFKQVRIVAGSFRFVK